MSGSARGVVLHLVLPPASILFLLLASTIWAAEPTLTSRNVPASGQEVLTLAEAADFLRLEPTLLEQLASQQALPGRRIGQEWRFSRSALLVWLKGDDTKAGEPAEHGTPATLPGASAELVTSAQLQGFAGRGASSPAEPPTAPVQPASVGEKPAARTAEEVFLRDQGVLLKRGQGTFEVDLAYAKSEQEELTGMTRVEQRRLSTAFAMHYGLINDMQLSARVPLQYRRDEVTVGTRSITDQVWDWGPIVFDLQHGILRERAGYPNIIVNLESQFPASNGAYALGGGLAFTKSLDPVILIGSLSYLHRFTRFGTDVTRQQSENSLGVTLGYTYALNDTLALSMLVSGTFSDRTTFAAGVLPARERYRLQLGLTALLSTRLYIEPTVAFGLGESAPDVTFGVSLPYVVDALWK